MTKNETTAAREAPFAKRSATWTPAKAQDIRESYYKAIEGLYALADALEIADASNRRRTDLCLTEHFLAVTAIDAMKKSDLGRVLVDLEPKRRARRPTSAAGGPRRLTMAANHEQPQSETNE